MSTPIANIHDAFFKQVLGDPVLAGAFFREHLPQDLVELLSSELPVAIPGSFVDEELRQHHSDLLFRIRLKSNLEAYTYVLVEHKSSPDPAARLQLLRYLVRMLVHWFDQNQQQLPLPPVLPLLAHHGPQGWKLSCEFSDLFGAVPAALHPYLPSFRHALIDLAPIDDGSLSTQARLRAFLKALKYNQRSDLGECFDVVLAEAATLSDRDLFVILTYLGKSPTVVSNETLQETLERLVPDRKERIVGWLTQPYYEKGKAEGEAKILARLLERRFGHLPLALQQRLFAADVVAIESWVERAFDAPDLQSVFESG